MSQGTQDTTCMIVCWGVGALAGVAAAAMLMSVGSYTFLQAAFVGALAFVVLSIVLSISLCGKLQHPQEAAMAKRKEMEDARARMSGEAPAPAPAPAPAAAAPAPAPEPVPEPAPAPVAEEPAVKSDTLLNGEEELASRKGEWSYEGEAAKPEALSAPKDGKADDLKLIKGVGPKLEILLHDLGFYHYEQIANWTAAEVAWVDDNLKGFKGRVSRDHWVDQAKILASGGETEFSKRAEH